MVRANAFVVNDLTRWIRSESEHHASGARKGFERMSKEVQILEQVEIPAMEGVLTVEHVVWSFVNTLIAAVAIAVMMNGESWGLWRSPAR